MGGENPLPHAVEILLIDDLELWEAERHMVVRPSLYHNQKRLAVVTVRKMNSRFLHSGLSLSELDAKTGLSDRRFYLCNCSIPTHHLKCISEILVLNFGR